MAQRDHFERTRSEQALIGLGAPEVGRVLMRTWELPDSVIAGVSALDARLAQPAGSGCDPVTLRDAWGYLCARLGERLMAHELTDLGSFDLTLDTSVELAAIRPLRADPRFASLLEQLRAPALLARIDGLIAERGIARAQPTTVEPA